MTYKLKSDDISIVGNHILKKYKETYTEKRKNLMVEIESMFRTFAVMSLEPHQQALSSLPEGSIVNVDKVHFNDYCTVTLSDWCLRNYYGLLSNSRHTPINAVETRINYNEPYFYSTCINLSQCEQIYPELYPELKKLCDKYYQLATDKNRKEIELEKYLKTFIRKGLKSIEAEDAQLAKQIKEALRLKDEEYSKSNKKLKDIIK